MAHFVYIIYSEKNNSFYAGQTVNVEERLKQHNLAYYTGAFTKRADDWMLFWKLQCETKDQAALIESHIKKMRNKNYYNNLKKYPGISEALLLKYKTREFGLKFRQLVRFLLLNLLSIFFRRKTGFLMAGY